MISQKCLPTSIFYSRAPWGQSLLDLLLLLLLLQRMALLPLHLRRQLCLPDDLDHLHWR